MQDPPAHPPSITNRRHIRLRPLRQMCEIPLAAYTMTHIFPSGRRTAMHRSMPFLNVNLSHIIRHSLIIICHIRPILDNLAHMDPPDARSSMRPRNTYRLKPIPCSTLPRPPFMTHASSNLLHTSPATERTLLRPRSYRWRPPRLQRTSDSVLPR